MQCYSCSGVTAEMPVQLSVCTGDIPTEGSGRLFGLLSSFFTSSGIPDLFSTGALGVC